MSCFIVDNFRGDLSYHIWGRPSHACFGPANVPSSRWQLSVSEGPRSFSDSTLTFLETDPITTGELWPLDPTGSGSAMVLQRFCPLGELQKQGTNKRWLLDQICESTSLAKGYEITREDVFPIKSCPFCYHCLLTVSMILVRGKIDLLYLWLQIAVPSLFFGAHHI